MTTWPARLASFIWSRADSAPEAAAVPKLTDRSGAAVRNAVSGLGGSADSGASARPNVYRRYLTDEELIANLRGTVYRRIVEALPEWATAKGFTLTDDTDDEKPLSKELKRLNVMSTFRKADNNGRTLGECIVQMVTDDPAPLDQPLDPSKVTKLYRLQVYDRREFTVVSYHGNPATAELGSPELYSITARRQGVVAKWQTVHASRFLRFYGDDLPPSELGFGRGTRHTWGADAIGQTLWDSIRNISQTSSAGARLAQELSIAVFTFQRGTAAASGDQRESFLKRIRALNYMKSVVQAIWLTVGETFQRVGANPSGFRDLSEDARLQLALVTGYPLALLFGEAPSGLSTDGASWIAAWSAKVGAYQQDRYLEPLEQLIEVIYYATDGAVPDEWGVSFNPLEQLTEEQLADLRTKHTMADVDAINGGIITEKEARGRYTQPGGFQLELQPLDEEIEKPEEMPAPEPQPQRPREFDERADFAASNQAVVWFPLSDAARAKHREYQEQASNVVGMPLTAGEPHLTVLFAGAIDDAAVQELAAITGQVSRKYAPSRGRVLSVETFASPEGTAIVLKVQAWEAERLQHELSNLATHLITAPQHPTYKPHITLGYVPRQLTARELAGLRDIRITGDPPKVAAPASEFAQVVPVGTAPWHVSLSALEIKRNGQRGDYLLTGERNDAENHDTVRAK